MSFARKTTRLAGSGGLLLALGAGYIGAAGAAQAAPATAPVTTCLVSTPIGQPTTDSVTLNNVGGISFGASTVDSGNNPICGATLAWNIPTGTTKPDLAGFLHMKNSVGKTARVHVQYYDIHGNFIKGQLGGDKLATTNHQSFPIGLGAVDDPDIYRADVSTEVKTGKTYSPVGMTSVYIASINHPNVSCTIDTAGVELGGAGGVSGGHPVNAATCGWQLTATDFRATVNGTEWFENGLGRTARLAFSTYDVHGTQLDRTNIARNSPSANGIVSFPVSSSSRPVVAHLDLGRHRQAVGPLDPRVGGQHRRGQADAGGTRPPAWDTGSRGAGGRRSSRAPR